MSRKLALQETGDAAAAAVQQLEQVKRWLSYLTPDEAQLWFKARQACDFLYAAVNKP